MNDANEQNFLSGLWGSGEGSWLGLNNRDDVNVFKWVSGEQSSFTNWDQNEPKISTEKRCAWAHYSKSEKLWVMEDCALGEFRYTCEKG